MAFSVNEVASARNPQENRRHFHPIGEAAYSVVEFTEPTRGVRYAALKKNATTTDGEKTLAVRLIEEGQRLAASSDPRDVAGFADSLDLARDLVTHFDSSRTSITCTEISAGSGASR